MPEVSIVLPCFNAAIPLRQAVQSILDQTFENWELLLVDDGSTDSTLQTAETLAKADSRIRVMARPHEGIAASLNAGMEAASAPLIARMDADDFAFPNRIELQKQFLELHPLVGLVSGRVQFGGDEILSAGYAAYVNWINSLLTHEQIFLNRFVESPIAHPSVMFRKSLVEKWGAYARGDFPEDYELWLRWLEKGVRMEKLPDTLLTWADPPQRLSRTSSAYAPDAFYRVKAQYLIAWLKTLSLPGEGIWIWGAGRITRQRAQPLLQSGLPVRGWLDVDPGKIENKYHGLPVEDSGKLPAAGRRFIVSMVSNRGARKLIQAFLEERGYSAGIDFIAAG